MTSDLNCPSLIELLDLRLGEDDAATAAHLESCPRCQALLAALPGKLELPELPPPTRAWALPERVRQEMSTPHVSTGTLWRAVPEAEDDFAWVVAIIGRAPDADDRLLVAPVVGEAPSATDCDLLLDDTVLGYEAFVDLGNIGVIIERQLREPLAELPGPAVQALVGLYHATLGAGDPPADELTGAPALEESDPRLLATAERHEALRSLWRAADAQVDDLDEFSSAEPVVVPVSPAPISLAAALEARLVGPAAEWDRATLLEDSGADGASLDAFLADRLDLTDKGDVPDLARVLRSLELPWDEAEPAVVTTLTRSSGGSRHADGPTLPMAARSRPGSSEEEIAEQLYADQSLIDASAQARQREIAVYLTELRRALDDLE